MIGRALTLSLAVAALAGCQGTQDAGNNAAASSGTGDSSSGSAGQRAGGSNIGDTIAQTPDLSQFNQAMQSAGLGQTFRGSVPYTVFAPVNAAFEAVPQETRTRLMAPEGREQLTQLLTFHIVPGVVTSQDLAHAMERGHGRATLATIAGSNLTVSREGDAFVLTDAAGGRARIAVADRRQSNGIIHQIDAVLMPARGE
jgi:uncharacterized surface protein with fasciclin (FAS1) repeats